MMVVGKGRLVRAVLLGLFLVLLLGSGTGLALAQSKGASEPAMARPMPGDHAVFSADEFHIGEARGELKGLRLELTWMPERWVPDQDLNLRLVHPLVTRVLLGDLDLQRQADYDAATGEVVLTSGYGEYYGGSSSSGALGIYQTGAEQSYWYDSYEGRGGPCGARNALQDGQSLDEPLLVTGYCDYVDGDETLVYEHVGTSRIDGRKAAHFQEPDRPYFQLWASPEVPFPVRFTASLSNVIYAPFLGHERMYDLRLQSYTPGEGSYTWPAEPVVVPGIGLPSMVPRAPLVVDTSDYPFPFPFQVAYDAAVRDTSSNGLAGWMRTHPDAYVAEAYSQEYTDENGARHLGWAFIVTDGHDWTGRYVREGPWGSVLGLWAPEQAGRGPWVVPWTPDGEERNWAGHYLPPDRLPDLLPSANDVLARHRFVENRDIPGAHYVGWSLTCATPACLEPDLVLQAGYLDSRYTRSGVPVVMPSGHTYEVSLLTVGADGVPQGRYAYSMDQPTFTVADVQSQGGPSGGFSLAPAAIQAEGVWVLPGPAAATGLGLLGVLASVLYYFWPHLKGLALAPLFSRIADDEVLDNPNRARILEIIRAEPGIHFQDLSRKAAVGRGTLDHHLRKLVDAELVSVRRTSGYSCCFPKGAGAIDRRLMDAAPVLRSQGGRAVLEVVARRPGASSRDLAVELGLAPSTVSYHLKRLETAGLVLPAGGMGVRLTPLGEQAGSKAA
jgi:DNA-binding MarR family transcriptional regulator